jgi:hypothetical protein
MLRTCLIQFAEICDYASRRLAKSVANRTEGSVDSNCRLVALVQKFSSASGITLFSFGLLITLLGAPARAAQTSEVGGTVEGNVHDASGAVVQGRKSRCTTRPPVRLEPLPQTNGEFSRCARCLLEHML